MNYHKRIILDFDDTLAFHQNRDWANSKPNSKLIEKTNALYDQGWQIDIFTARGSISCSSRQEAMEKYKPGMEEWLNRHGVKYHSISFDKPLAAYYVDDKGMSPDNFVNINIQKLEGGLSGSDIYSDGTMVHKKDANAHRVRAWYDNTKFVNLPKIDRVVGDIITMEYVRHDKDFFKDNVFVALGLIQDTLSKLKRNHTDTHQTFLDYVYRIEGHVEASNVAYFSEVLEKLRLLNLEPSYSHGDFGITNMLFNDGKLFLIDPIPNVFGCTELDAAKFVASLYINNYPREIIDLSKKSMMVYNSIKEDVFNVIVATEIIRVYRYHPDKKLILECVRNVFE